jgi:LysM repeat protein
MHVMSLSFWRSFASAGLIFLLGAACTPKGETTTPMIGGVLDPYRTATSDVTNEPDLTPGAARTAFPTPTPFTYTVVPNDTLIGIAQRFGVRLEDLIAANPSVSPTGLTVGTTLKIPTGPQDLASGEPTPTPVPLIVAPPDCYPTIDRGLWCFVKVTNPYPDTLENLTAQVTISDAGGQMAATQTAAAPLDILPPGKSIPLATFFAPPVPSAVKASAQLVTAIRLPPDDERYITAFPQNVLVAVDWSGRSAQVSGQVASGGGGAAKQIWVVGVAYDGSGKVVGYRRWESATGTLVAGNLPFAFTVAGIGGKIARVEVLVEARP